MKRPLAENFWVKEGRNLRKTHTSWEWEERAKAKQQKAWEKGRIAKINKIHLDPSLFSWEKERPLPENCENQQKISKRLTMKPLDRPDPLLKDTSIEWQALVLAWIFLVCIFCFPTQLEKSTESFCLVRTEKEGVHKQEGLASSGKGQIYRKQLQWCFFWGLVCSSFFWLFKAAINMLVS